MEDVCTHDVNLQAESSEQCKISPEPKSSAKPFTIATAVFPAALTFGRQQREAAPTAGLTLT